MVEVDSFPHYMSRRYSCSYRYIISPSSCITRNQLHDCFMSESKSMWHIFRGTFCVCLVIQNSLRYIHYDAKRLGDSTNAVMAKR